MTNCYPRNTDCRVTSLLAMTGGIETLRRLSRFHCHCEAPTGPWQSVSPCWHCLQEPGCQKDGLPRRLRLLAMTGEARSTHRPSSATVIARSRRGSGNPHPPMGTADKKPAARRTDCRVASLLAMTGGSKKAMCRPSSSTVIARPQRGHGNP